MLREPHPDHVVWLDGEFVPWRTAVMHVTSHHYGFGVFEGVRSYATGAGASIFRLDDHTRRLLRSAQIMKIQLPSAYDRDYLNRVQVELVGLNKLRDAYLRPFVFYSGTMSLRPSTLDLSVHVAVMALDWGATANDRQRGIALRTSNYARSPASALLTKAKTNGHYVGGMLALQEAQACGADDALQLDGNGFVTECTGANLFVVRDGIIRTPPLSMVLEGITRDTIIKLATVANWTVSEGLLTREDVYTADEVFLTGTATEITPVREVDGRRIGSGAPGPITRHLQAMYAAHVRGRDEHQRKWLTPV